VNAVGGVHLSPSGRKFLSLVKKRKQLVELYVGGIGATSPSLQRAGQRAISPGREQGMKKREKREEWSSEVKMW